MADYAGARIELTASCGQNCKHRLELSEQCVQKQQQEHLDSLETSSWIPFALKMIGLAQLERGYHQYSAALQLLGEAASCIAVYLIVYCVLLTFLGPEVIISNN